MLKRRRTFLLAILSVGISSLTPASSQETYYCVQLLSSPSLTRQLKKKFSLLKSFPDSRVEKIGNYYTLRVGFWREKRKAEKYYRLLRKRFPGAFVRTCYKITSRWVLPKKAEEKKKLKESSFLKVKNPPPKQPSVNYGKLAKEYYSSYTPTSPEFKAFEFPQTRVNKEKTEHFVFTTSAVGTLYGKNFYRAAIYLSTKRFSAGISLKKNGSSRVELFVPNFIFLDKTFDRVTDLNLKLGVLNREKPYENLSAPAVSLYWNTFPFRGELTAGFAFKNGYNDVDLRNLLFTSFYGSYRFLPDLTFSGGFLFENLVKRKLDFYPFSSRSYFFSSLNYKKVNFSVVSSSKGGYLADLSAKLGNFELGLSSDKNLPLPLTSKGHLYTERGRDYLFVADPLNLQRFSLKFFKGKSGLSVNYYRLNGSSTILESRYFSSGEKGTLGLSVGGFYGVYLKNLYLDLYGGVFFPGAPFSDKSPKGAGGINLRGIW